VSPQRIQRQRSKGWRKPDGCVIVTRPTKWGNPFRIGALVRDPGWSAGPAHPYDGPLGEGTYSAFEVRRVRDAADATDLFRAYVEFHDDEWPPDVIRRELGGKDLACWCPLPAPGEPDHCHAAVLLRLAATEGP
jgi:hypothetical protein